MDKYYKWTTKKGDVFCAIVINGGVAHYYKNGEVYALYQGWISQSSDLEITEQEFNELKK